MVPHERSGMSLRWEFSPHINLQDGAVHWRWHSYTQAGKLFAESEGAFETLTECIADAEQHGYRR
jgi:hypothetical protein